MRSRFIKKLKSASHTRKYVFITLVGFEFISILLLVLTFLCHLLDPPALGTNI